MVKSAEISACGLFRYGLKRVWAPDLQMLVVCMLNPSDADATINDPTILTLIDRATRWGFGGLWVVNQNAFRSPHPAVMAAAAVDPVGPENWYHCTVALHYARMTAGFAVAAWGNGGDNNAPFVTTALEMGVALKCLGATKDGSPKHPLARGVHRIPRDQPLEPWNPA